MKPLEGKATISDIIVASLISVGLCNVPLAARADEVVQVTFGSNRTANTLMLWCRAVPLMVMEGEVASGMTDTGKNAVVDAVHR